MKINWEVDKREFSGGEVNDLYNMLRKWVTQVYMNLSKLSECTFEIYAFQFI